MTSSAAVTVSRRQMRYAAAIVATLAAAGVATAGAARAATAPPVQWCGLGPVATDQPDVVAGPQIHVIYALSDQRPGPIRRDQQRHLDRPDGGRRLVASPRLQPGTALRPGRVPVLPVARGARHLRRSAAARLELLLRVAVALQRARGRPRRRPVSAPCTRNISSTTTRQRRSRQGTSAARAPRTRRAAAPTGTRRSTSRRI